jgi:hypothetical protein
MGTLGTPNVKPAGRHPRTDVIPPSGEAQTSQACFPRLPAGERDLLTVASCSTEPCYCRASWRRSRRRSCLELTGFRWWSGFIILKGTPLPRGWHRPHRLDLSRSLLYEP